MACHGVSLSLICKYGSLNAVINLATERGMSYTYDSLGRITRAAPARCSSDIDGFTDFYYLGKADYSYNYKGYLTEIIKDFTTYTFS